MTDASNHKDVKIFPLVIRYSVKGKIDHFLYGVENLPGEEAKMIADMIMNTLFGSENNDGLKMEKFYVLGTDNTNTNMGGVNQPVGDNVLTHLRGQIADLFGQGCFGHVVHNAGEKGADALSMDFENFVLKIHSFFNGQTKRSVELQEFCEFVEVEFLRTLRHVNVRWLSLNPAIQRALHLMPALESMFVYEEDLPDDTLPPRKFREICDFVNDPKSLPTGHFMVSILREFEEATLILEV